jgi:glycosyltransferase involved in cell wall biosynthesis
VEFFRGWPRVRRTHNKTVPYLIPRPIDYLRALGRIRPEVIVESIFTTLTPRSHLNHAYARLTGTRRILMDSGDVGRIRRLFPFERSAIRQATAIFTYSPGGAERIRGKYGLGESPPVHVHYKALPEGRFHFDESCFDRTRLVVGYVGRLLKAKGFDRFIEVAGRLSDRAKFVVAGVNEDQFQMPSSVRYDGVVPNERLAGLYSEIDVLVVPDLTDYQSFPTVAQESLLCGSVLMVGSASRTMFPDDRYVEWCDPSKVEDLARRLKALAARPRPSILELRREVAAYYAKPARGDAIIRDLTRAFAA